jgi:aldose 1-epimerase
VEVGGGLRTYRVGDRALLDGYDADEMCPTGRGQVLLPWPNRLEDGTYEFEGRVHRLPLNEPESRNAIHGLVRWSAWSLREREPARIVVERQLHPQPGYPFSLGVGIEYALSDDGLTVATTATNTGEDPSPYGCGFHPYLTVGTPTVDSVVLKAPGRAVLSTDDRGLPTGRTSVEGTEYDFTRLKAIGSTVLDHCFTDLDRDEGVARVELRAPDGAAASTLWLDDTFGYLMLFTGDPFPDVNRRSIAVEPMTCPPNAFRTGEALIRLEPGESFTSTWGLTPTA